MIIPQNILRCMDAEVRRQYGKTGWLPEEVIERAALVLEREEHSTVLNWLRLHRIQYIHASTARRVKDLPPGWPDFTIFYGSRFLLLEMKMQGGHLSQDQIDRHVALSAHSTGVLITGSAVQTIAQIRKWLTSLGAVLT